ncbi:MAG: hypothetical protein CM1200mP3_06210 [Chloroflexota bacterium]|nr:MAG: hypothetical protein CM1200mP3_06210 [Chloroflexota bacterium]
MLPTRRHIRQISQAFREQCHHGFRKRCTWDSCNITAETLNISPEEVADKYQKEFLSDWSRLGINFDLFTSKHTENHEKVSQDIFTKNL